MASITRVSDIISRVNTTLQDQDLRWSLAEKIQWVNDAHKAIVLIRPDAGMHSADFTCVASTHQSLTQANGLSDLSAYTPVRLRQVVRNKPVSGTGRAIRHEHQRVLDDQLPDWHATASSTACQFFVFDPAAPTEFYLYPAPAAGHKVEVTYSATPATALGNNDYITLDDIWVPIITDYVLYRCYTKDAEYTANMERAAAHYKTFSDAVLASVQAQNNVPPVDDGRVTINRTA